MANTSSMTQTRAPNMAPLFNNIQLQGDRGIANPVQTQQPQQPQQQMPSTSLLGQQNSQANQQTQTAQVDQQLVQLLHSNPQLADMLSQNPQLVQQIESNPQLLSQLTSHMQQGGQAGLPAGFGQANQAAMANPQSVVGPDSLVAANSAHSQTAQGHSIKQVIDQAVNTPEGQQMQSEMQAAFNSDQDPAITGVRN